MEDVIRMSSLLQQDVLITEQRLVWPASTRIKKGRLEGEEGGVRRPERVKLSQIR